MVDCFFLWTRDGIMMDYVLEANPLVDYRWWCPSSLANLLHITPISPWFMVDVSWYIYTYYGVINQFITTNISPITIDISLISPITIDISAITIDISPITIDISHKPQLLWGNVHQGSHQVSWAAPCTIDADNANVKLGLINPAGLINPLCPIFFVIWKQVVPPD